MSEQVKKEAPIIKVETPIINGLLEKAPEMMAELTRSFQYNKDLNQRAKIRLQMKAVLDMLSVDTTYPSVAKKEKTADGGDGYVGDGYVPWERRDRDPVLQNENILNGGEAQPTLT
jgi:hypothetical protein